MFEDSLVESSGKLARRSPSTLAFSFAAQMLIAGVLVLLPLICMEALPEQHLLRMLEAPAPPPGPAPRHFSKALPTKQASELDHGLLRFPVAIPNKIVMVEPEEAPPNGQTEGSGLVQSGLPIEDSTALMSSILKQIPVGVPKIPKQKIAISSGVAQGLLIHQVTPQYPMLARQARIQGTVVLQAVIGRDGTVQNLHVVSGHPMLTQAAIEAVKQWRYKPYYLNGEPVEVDTQININFTLSSG